MDSSAKFKQNACISLLVKGIKNYLWTTLRAKKKKERERKRKIFGSWSSSKESSHSCSTNTQEFSAADVLSTGNSQGNKQPSGRHQTMGPVGSSSLHKCRESICCWRMTLLASFYVIPELLAAKAAGGQAWGHSAQSSRKATGALCYRFWRVMWAPGENL